MSTPEWRCPEKGCGKRIDTTDETLFRMAVTSHMKGHGKAVRFTGGKKKNKDDGLGPDAVEIVVDIGLYRASSPSGSGGGGFWSFLDDLF